MSPSQRRFGGTVSEQSGRGMPTAHVPYGKAVLLGGEKTLRMIARTGGGRFAPRRRQQSQTHLGLETQDNFYRIGEMDG